VAALVAGHLGAENVRRYLTYGQEEGSVDVLNCAQMEGQRGRRDDRLWCEDLANGGVTFVELTRYGFSDDNTEGKTLIGLAAEPDGRLANAMYESYTPSVGVDPEDLLALMADERLAWSTDPSLNEAVRDINIRRMAG